MSERLQGFFFGGNMMTEKDAVQLEKDSHYKEIRHLCSLCTCPSYVTITELKYILSVLKGEK